MKLSDINRKKLHTMIAKSHYQNFIEHALDGMQVIGRDPFDWGEPYKIEPKIHRIILSGLYDFKQVRAALGKLHIDSKFDPAKEKSAYRTKAVKKVKSFNVGIRTNPIAFRPLCRFIIDPQGDVSIKEYKKLLQWLNAGLPGLKVSSVEYANDQFCINPQAVENLFQVEMRHLFVPRQRKMRMYGDRIAEWGEKTRMNAVIRIGNNNKLYERGPDKIKHGKGWLKEDVDRVRLEHTAKRTELRHKGIDKLGDLIAHPQFHDVNKTIYRFRQFHKSRSLPHPWEAYEHGEKDSFQGQHIHYRKKLTNIGQYLIDTHELMPLIKRLYEIWRGFDEEWRTI